MRDVCVGNTQKCAKEGVRMKALACTYAAERQNTHKDSLVRIVNLGTLTSKREHTHTPAHTCTLLYTLAHTYTHMHAYAHKHTHTHTNPPQHQYADTRTPTHTPTHKYTHTRAHSNSYIIS